MSKTRLERNEADLEARYWRGVALREKEKCYSLLENALRDLSYVIEEDSLFKDVLYQYALTLSARDGEMSDRTDAIRLTERQLQLKPELRAVRFGILELYNELLRSTNLDRAGKWLREHGSIYAKIFDAKALRRKGDLIAADVRLAEAISSISHGDANEVLDPVILLARARVHYGFERPDRAEPFVIEAIDRIRNRQEAQILFDEFKYILDEDELAEYYRTEPVDSLKRFFASVWVKRNPLPGVRPNLMLAEYYRRLDYAERHFTFHGCRAWFNEPVNHLNEIGFESGDFPATFYVAGRLDDRGIIYMRHGEPSDREAHRGLLDAESWQYNDPEMDFHFATSGSGKGVGNYRLRPTPHKTIVQKVMGWDGRYMALAKDWSRTEEWVVRESREQLKTGLTTSRYTWPDSLQPVFVPFITGAFRGPDGSTLLSVYYGIPLGTFSGSDFSADTIEVETTLALNDLSWKPVVIRSKPTQLLAKSMDARAAAIDFFHIAVPPDSYHVNLSAQARGRVAVHQLTRAVPDFRGDDLAMSDVLPLYGIGPAEPGNRYNRGDLLPRVNPSGSFRIGEEVYVYFEIYGLTYGPDDRTHYTTTLTLREQRRRNFLARIFGREHGDTGISVKTVSSSDNRDVVEYMLVNLDEVQAGKHEMHVTVRDENIGRSVTGRVTLSLMK